jgi:predicted N-acyltransferase
MGGRARSAGVRVLRAVAEVPAAAWNALLDDAARPFLDHRYLAALEESGTAAHNGWHPRHLVLYRGKTLVAAAPAYLKQPGAGEFVDDSLWDLASRRLGLPWHPKLVLGLPFTPITGRRLLVGSGEDAPALRQALLRAAEELAHGLGLSSLHAHFHLEEESAAFEAEGYVPRLGVQYHWINEGYGAPEDFLARFRSSRRNQLRRERRAVAEAGVELRTLRGAELSAAPEALYQLYAGTARRNGAMPYLAEGFFARLVRDMPEVLELVEARRGGQRMAAALNICGPEALYGRYWGCVEDLPFLHFAVCLYHPVDDCIRRGVRRFEPGAGGEHKLARGFSPVLTRSAHRLLHPPLAARVARSLAAERAAILSGLPAWRIDSGLKQLT